jgi:DNA-binding protein H-NS
MEEKIKMVSAAARLIEFKKQNPLAIDEEVFQNVSDYISEMKDIKNEKIKIGMMAAASEAFNISKENPRLTEKEVLRMVVKEIPNILSGLNQEELK